MAEYVEVMEQKRRMCNSYALCGMGCPLKDIDFCNKNVGEKISADFPEVERRVMSWAAEYPEPKYPTWAEYIAMLMLDDITRRNDSTPQTLGLWMNNTPIPADLAQKLGIEPKEG